MAGANCVSRAAVSAYRVKTLLRNTSQSRHEGFYCDEGGMKDGILLASVTRIFEPFAG
mgnify:CR=1 FL=1